MKIRNAAALALFLLCAPALAQQTPIHSVPIGKGVGNTGFNAAVPGTAGRPLVSQGATTDPAFGTIANSGLTAGPANSVKGSLDGTSVTDEALPACTGVNQALRWTAGVGFVCGTVSVNTGFDMPVNLGLFASASGNALTITLTQASGAAPTSTNPVLVPFRSTVATTGTVTWSTISATQSIVVPAGATLGTSSSNVPFRVWIFEEYNGGAPELAVATCSNPTTIFPCAAWDSSLTTTTTIGGASNTGGVPYATTGVAADAVRIIGYCTFSSGLTTAGTWASSCTGLHVFGSGMKRPGDVVQTAMGAIDSTQALAGTVTKVQTTTSVPITPSSAPNLIKVQAAGNMTTNQGSNACLAQLSRGTSPTLFGRVGGLVSAVTSSSGTLIDGSISLAGIDAPGVVSALTYYVFIWQGGTGNSCDWNRTSSGTNAFIWADEIMG